MSVMPSAPTLWALGGLALCAAEMLTPGVFLLWIGVAALATAAVTWAADLDPAWQVGAFVALLVVSVGFAMSRLRSGRHQDGTDVNAPTRGLVGETCRALAFQGCEGRVSLRDGTWPARMAGSSIPGVGDTLRIVRLEGTTLIVTPL